MAGEQFLAVNFDVFALGNYRKKENLINAINAHTGKCKQEFIFSSANDCCVIDGRTWLQVARIAQAGLSSNSRRRSRCAVARGFDRYSGARTFSTASIALAHLRLPSRRAGRD